jgi:hypothetical protein
MLIHSKLISKKGKWMMGSIEKSPEYKISRGSRGSRGSGVLFFILLIGALCFLQHSEASGANPNPPQKPIKLIFIHHSCGENWLADDHGGLGVALTKNNYFVSDTNYGWGPDSIGDRTDIINWPEWFTGPSSRKYLKSLYTNSQKHADYTRNIQDPGGENRIIMFKSCFPNSNIGGKPDDAPARGDGLTVGNAKAVYNELLTYFSAHPDKLFIIVTAPPVLDGTYAANARAFNKWLVNDWLADYNGTNVGVFDFYNILTGSNHHHRFNDGKIEHRIGSRRNTLFYPTGEDEHPSPKGNRKATREFVQLLNVIYHRWSENAPANAPEILDDKVNTAPDHSPNETPESVLSPRHTVAGPDRRSGVIDDFETPPENWQAFLDTEKNARLTFHQDLKKAHGGKAGLCIEYDIPFESWATCSLVYSSPDNWRKYKGLRLFYHAEKSGLPFSIIAYEGTSSDALSHFEFPVSTTATDAWQQVDILWNQFRKPEWEGDTSARFNPEMAIGLALGFSGTKENTKGKVWIDNILFLQ